MDAILQTAADWRARQDAGLTSDETAEFTRWRDADPRHEELYNELDQTWSILDRTSEIPEAALRAPVDRAQSNSRQSDRGPSHRPPPTVLRLPSPVPWLAAAAAIALVWTAWTLWPRSTPQDFQQTVESTSRYTKRLDLPDGSVIRMNSATEVTVNYTAASRTVQLLRGEAHFDVAKNKDRPFIVEAAGAAVRAVGTAFNVALKPDNLEVIVTEGRVAVGQPTAEFVSGKGLVNSGFRIPDSGSDTSAPSNSDLRSPNSNQRTPNSDLRTATSAPPVRLVSAGEKLVLPLEPARPSTVAAVAPAEVSEALAWQNHKLEFESAPLADILAEFNRYNVHQLVIAPGSGDLARERFGGSFRADDPDTFIQLLKLRSNIIIEPGPQQTVIRRAE